MQRRTFVAVLAGAVLIPRLSAAAVGSWKLLPIGAGGWVTNLLIANDGTKIVRTDSYGAYLWSDAADRWLQLVTDSRMPVADVKVENNYGCYSLAIAPSDSDRMFMMYNGQIYVTSNKATAWTLCSDFSQVTADANDTYRMCGEKMAVDPADPDVCYAGTPDDGLWVTTNAGTTWSLVSTGSVPIATDDRGILCIVFDSSNGTTGGKTNNIYVCSAGNGVYRTTNAGSSWSLLSGGVTLGRHADVDSTGVYWIAANDSSGIIKKYDSGWSTAEPSDVQDWHGVIVDPNDDDRVIVYAEGAFEYETIDGGSNWAAVEDSVWDYNWVTTGDVLWLDFDKGLNKASFWSAGALRFDPITQNKIWQSDGIGVWHQTLSPGSPGGQGVTFQSQSRGINQLVANQLVCPPGGRPVMSQWDRPWFRSPSDDTYPTGYGPDWNFNHGWGIDWATGDPTFIAAIATGNGEASGYSDDGGVTWNSWGATPSGGHAFDGYGAIAASTPTNIVWIPGNGGRGHYTTDGGDSWTVISLPGVANDATEDGWGGVGGSQYLRRYIVAADRVTANTFYIYHYTKGVFKSTNSGATFTNVYNAQLVPFDYYNAKLCSVPGKAGHLFYTAGGSAGSPASGAFRRSTNAGATWSDVSNVLEVYAYGFGKIAPGQSYPVVFIAGWVSGTWGVYRSDDECSSWVSLGQWPNGSIDAIESMDGDKDRFGTVYIGHAGSGYAYYSLSTYGDPGVKRRGHMGSIVLP